MVWAQKNTSVLAVGVSFGPATQPISPALLVDHTAFENAEAALASSSYAVMVVDGSGEEEGTKRLVDYARALHPHIRVIFASRRPPAKPFTGGGDVLVAGNGRQFLRGLRQILGCH